MRNIFEIIELFLEDDVEISGVNALSYVHDPAIEADFFAFDKQYMTNFASVDEEKRMVTGPALIPNKMILRKLQDKYFYVYFSEDTVRKTAHKFVRSGKQTNSTYEHTAILENVSVVESWIVEDKVHDKSVKYGFDLPVGTWMLTSKIDDDDLWEAIKRGDVKGYSIEGKYSDKILENQEVTIEDIAELELLGTDEERETYKQIVQLIEDISNDEQTQ